MSTLLLYRKRRVLFHFFFWTVGFLTSFTTYSTLGASWFAVAISASNTLILAGLFYGNVWLVRRYFLSGEKSFYFFSAILLLVLAIFCRFYENSWLMDTFDSHPKAFPPLVMVVTGALLLLGCLAASFALVIWEDRMMKERQQLELMDQMKEAQLKYLKMQINPHFLFNSINNIYGLALNGSKNTAESLLTLSEILRYSLYSNQEDTVPVEDEIKQIRTLIALYVLRKKTPLNIQFTITGDPGSKRIPVMLFLPIIENCFKHGDIFMNRDGFIYIHINITADEIQFKSENSYKDAMQKDDVGGIGLHNIQERLRIIYPEAHQLEYYGKDQLFCVNLILKQ